MTSMQQSHMCRQDQHLRPSLPHHPTRTEYWKALDHGGLHRSCEDASVLPESNYSNYTTPPSLLQLESILMTKYWLWFTLYLAYGSENTNQQGAQKFANVIPDWNNERQCPFFWFHSALSAIQQGYLFCRVAFGWRDTLGVDAQWLETPCGHQWTPHIFNREQFAILSLCNTELWHIRNMPTNAIFTVTTILYWRVQ